MCSGVIWPYKGMLVLAYLLLLSGVCFRVLTSKYEGDTLNALQGGGQVPSRTHPGGVYVVVTCMPAIQRETGCAWCMGRGSDCALACHAFIRRSEVFMMSFKLVALVWSLSLVADTIGNAMMQIFARNAMQRLFTRLFSHLINQV